MFSILDCVVSFRKYTNFISFSLIWFESVVSSWNAFIKFQVRLHGTILFKNSYYLFCAFPLYQQNISMHSDMPFILTLGCMKNFECKWSQTLWCLFIEHNLKKSIIIFIKKILICYFLNKKDISLTCNFHFLLTFYYLPVILWWGSCIKIVSGLCNYT